MAKADQSELNNESHSELGGPVAIRARPVKLLGQRFQLDSRYEVFDIVGSGAYGVVAAAVDSVTGEQVGIKKLERAFQHHILAKRTLRELKIMRLLKHDNLLGIKSIQLPVSRTKLDDLYIVTELMATDLSSLLKSDQILTDDHCSFFLYQLLRGLKYMHSANVVHRDLKPRNILLNSDCELKICDFGLARLCTGVIRNATKMTDYVATRWYRSPELLLRLGNYGFAMDVWALGCILGEMLLRKPLLTGQNSLNQIELIVKFTGRPARGVVDRIPDEEYREVVRKLPRTPTQSIDAKLAHCNPLAVDLLKQMLKFDSDERITIEEALKHPYVAHLHLAEDEPVAEPLCPYDFSFEKRQLNMKIVKELIYEEIALYHFHLSKAEYECDRRTFQEIGNSFKFVK